jgi:hypothetical protein
MSPPGIRISRKRFICMEFIFSDVPILTVLIGFRRRKYEERTKSERSNAFFGRNQSGSSTRKESRVSLSKCFSQRPQRGLRPQPKSRGVQVAPRRDGVLRLRVPKLRDDPEIRKAGFPGKQKASVPSAQNDSAWEGRGEGEKCWQENSNWTLCHREGKEMLFSR